MLGQAGGVMIPESRIEDTVDLPVGWWPRLYDLIVRTPPDGWGSVKNFCDDLPTIAYKTLVRAREKGYTSRRSFNTLVNKLGFQSAEALERHLKGVRQAAPENLASNPDHDVPLVPRGQRVSGAVTQISATGDTLASVPDRLFTAQYDFMQGADPWELDLDGRRLDGIGCTVETESGYFRFGFKLLTEHGRLFGDGSIQSQDANLVVHVGRNNWDRADPAISARDIFLAWYENAKKGGKDRKDVRLFTAESRVILAIRLEIDSGNVLQFFVNGECYLRVPVPPEIRRRVAMIAWGDHGEFTVRASNIQIHSSPLP